MRQLRDLLASLLLALCGLTLVAAAVPDDEEIADLERELRRANSMRGDPAAATARRTEVLDQLIATGDDEALDVIRDAFATYARREREARYQVEAKTYVLERKRLALAEAQARAEAGGERGPARALEGEVNTLMGEVADERGKAERAARVAHELGAGAMRLIDTYGQRKRKRLEERIWDTALEGAEDGSDVQVRLGAVELLGLVGGPGTAEGCQELIARIHGLRVRLQRQLPALEREVRKYQQRMQEAMEEQGGFDGGLQQQYARAQAETAAVHTGLQRLGFLIEAAVESGGAALAREPQELLERSLQKLMRAQARADGGLRAHTLDLIAGGDSPQVRSALRELLVEEDEPLARAQVIDGLARVEDPALVDLLLQRFLADESWHVRARAVAALERMRPLVAVEALIARLEVEEEGRLRGDISAALRSLTHERFGARHELWARWWADHRAGYQLPPPRSAEERMQAQIEGIGLSFFGIPTDSERVIYIIDTSGSMNEPMYLRSDGRGGETRLEAAKRELIRSLGQLPDGGLFNIVTYASDMEPWQRSMVVMEEDTRQEAIAFVESLTAIGGTNIHGCLQLGFELAGVEPGDEWSNPEVDTFFLLTDGMASVGVTVDQDQILDFASEMNRAAGIVIHTIGLGHEQDAYLLRGLAEQNGGSYAAR